MDDDAVIEFEGETELLAVKEGDSDDEEEGDREGDTVTLDEIAVHTDDDDVMVPV